jgi:hypothetical protein
VAPAGSVTSALILHLCKITPHLNDLGLKTDGISLALLEAGGFLNEHIVSLVSASGFGFRAFATAQHFRGYCSDPPEKSTVSQNCRYLGSPIIEI